jgi:hypothetical protein
MNVSLTPELEKFVTAPGVRPFPQKSHGGEPAKHDLIRTAQNFSLADEAFRLRFPLFLVESNHQAATVCRLHCGKKERNTYMPVKTGGSPQPVRHRVGQ